MDRDKRGKPQAGGLYRFGVCGTAQGHLGWLCVGAAPRQATDQKGSTAPRHPPYQGGHRTSGTRYIHAHSSAGRAGRRGRASSPSTHGGLRPDRPSRGPGRLLSM